jgi:hypothetical protein
MPDRVLADSLISSESASRLSDAAERLFLRIVAAPTTDNWGRRKAGLSQLRADCIPLLQWTDEQILAALEELVREEMIQLYAVDGRSYLTVTNWDLFQRRAVSLRQRHGESRIPSPPGAVAAAARGAPPHTGLPDRAPAELSLDQPSAAIETQDLDLPTVLEVHAARARDAGGDWRGLDGLARFRALASTLHGADARTPVALAAAARGLPEAAIHTALESLEKRRRKRPQLQSEARYMVGTLTRMREEGQYQR